MVRSSFLVTAFVGAALLAGCSEDPQHRYQAAAKALEKARADRAEAADAVEARKKALAEQQEKLEQAKQKLAKARERLQQANTHVDQAVSDEVLFRAVQRAVLDSERFPDAAISVGVNDRVVTLTGTVPDKATKQAALEAARKHPGVRELRDELTIRASDSGSQSNSES